MWLSAFRTYAYDFITKLYTEKEGVVQNQKNAYRNIGTGLNLTAVRLTTVQVTTCRFNVR